MKHIALRYFLLSGIATLLLVIVTLMLLWQYQNNPQHTQLSQVLSRGVLRVSTVHSPLSYDTDTSSKQTQGLDYALAKKFADYLGVRLEITARKNVHGLFDDLKHNRADLLAAGLMYNKESARDFRAGPAYYFVSQQLVYRVGKPRPRNLGELKGRLAVVLGSAHMLALQARKKNWPNLHWEIAAERNSGELLEQVAEGKLDYTISDSVTISLMQRIHPQIAVAFDLTDELPVTWYMPKSRDTSLYVAMLDFFNQVNNDGTLARLEEKYLGHVGPFDYVDTRSFLRAVDNILPRLKPLFQKHAAELDWRLLAAIAYQESHWNPQATSPTGVRGLMMLTRNTAESLGVKDRLDPEQSIAGGARYLSAILKRIPRSIPEDERIWFALAAYNMGYTHLLDARQLTKNQKRNPDSWADVKTRLPLLSQKNYYPQTRYGYARGYEAYRYVENIRRYQLSLEGYLKVKERRNALKRKEKEEAEKQKRHPSSPFEEGNALVQN